MARLADSDRERWERLLTELIETFHGAGEAALVAAVDRLPRREIATLNAVVTVRLVASFSWTRPRERPRHLANWLAELAAEARCSPLRRPAMEALALETTVRAFRLHGATRLPLPSREWAITGIVLLDAIVSRHARATGRARDDVIDDIGVCLTRRALRGRVGSVLDQLLARRRAEADAAALAARVDANERLFSAKRVHRHGGPPTPTRVYDERRARAPVAVTLDARPAADVLADLDALPGLARVKAEVRLLADYLSVQKLRQARGLPAATPAPNLVFLGNPGTGKTMVARLLAELFASLGVVPEAKLLETDKSGLVDVYLGQTVDRTTSTFLNALGGVLFIDEAYALATSGDSFGQEAIDALVKLMEDYRGRIVLILAGYPAEMRRFLDANPGLKSRLTRVLEFDDYSDAELNAIFELFCLDGGYLPGPGAGQAMLRVLESERVGRTFGNARAVRNVFEEAVRHHASRVLAKGEPFDDVDLYTLLDVDIEAVARAPRPSVEDRVPGYI